MPDNNTRNVEIIAHRGASRDAPENTLAAVLLAWEQGADAVEVDCRMTRDRRVLVIHDADLRRVSGTANVVADCTFDQLKAVDVGRRRQAKFAGQSPPELGEVLATIPRGKRIFVEVKCGPEICEPLAEAFASSHCDLPQLAVISYSVPVLVEMKRRMPELAAYLVARFKRNLLKPAWSPTIDQLIAVAKDAGLDGLDIKAQGPLDAASAARVHEAGLGLYVWTVDSPRLARRMVHLGVDGIATNRPGWLREQLK